MKNFDMVCRFPSCTGKTEARGHFFCEDHGHYGYLSNLLFETRLGLQTEWPRLAAVYVLGSRNLGSVKVGIADNVMARIDALQTGLPTRIELFYANYTDRKSAEAIEHAVHVKLKEYDFHLHGEWFDSDPDDTNRVILKMAQERNTPTLTCGEYHSMMALWDDLQHSGAHELAATRRRIQHDMAQGLTYGLGRVN